LKSFVTPLTVAVKTFFFAGLTVPAAVCSTA
jgi:hypothetical protein